MVYYVSPKINIFYFAPRVSIRFYEGSNLPRKSDYFKLGYELGISWKKYLVALKPTSVNRFKTILRL